ncbi:MAG: hypothetical protein DLM59_02895 [Pseudonocardiales bacterium]|nr:MAG: hypothetical protein DLM59_02895 [Pseudonocardiales bacterium]
MSLTATCPRCAGPVRPPDLMSSEWRCELHGAVHPYYVAATVGPAALEHLTRHAAVPLWCPLPLLPGWTVTGAAHAGDERTGARATALACAGPAPLGGVADLLLVAEEPGVGLGAHYAGLHGPDAGREFTSVPDTKILVAGHPTPLWSVPAGDERCAFVGEAGGLWLWAVLWPLDAGYVFIEHVELHDLREHAPDGIVFGAPSPYLRPDADGPAHG